MNWCILLCSRFNIVSFYYFFLCFLQTKFPRAAQWQLDKWLQHPQKISVSREEDGSQGVSGNHHSPYNQPAPSPARSWDSNQEYSPSQTPIPSPQLHYNHVNSPLPSPGYSYCPSPSPFPSTCPSPSSSSQDSPVPSPDLSICPSPHGIPRTSRSPSPITREPPLSPCLSPPSPLTVHHYREVHNQTQPLPAITPHRPCPALQPKTVKSSQPAKSSHLPSVDHRSSKSKTTENQDQRKCRTFVTLDSKDTHSHKSRAKSSFPPGKIQHSEPPKAKHKTHSEQSESRRSSHNSNHKTASLFQRSSQHSPKRVKNLAPVPCEPNSGPSSHSNSTSTAVPNSKTGVNSKSNTSQKLQAKATAPPVHANPAKTPQKKSQAKQQEEHRGEHQNIPERRKQEKKQDRQREKPAGKPRRREDRRLAEEQLRRRPWIQSSAEEDEEGQEEDVVVIERPSNKVEKGRRSDKQHRSEWKAAHNKQLHNLPDQSQQQERADKGRSERSRHPSLQLSRSLTSQKPSSSSSASSSSDSESEYQATVPKVPAESTSHKRLSRSRLQGSADRPKEARPRGSSLVKTSEGQGNEGKQKLYTLVPFGRGDQASAFSQRGLRNLVVQIDLCLLKRVPESPASSPVKKAPSSSSSSSTNNSQREMKHALVPETGTRDGKRKRKVNSGISIASALLTTFFKIHACTCVRLFVTSWRILVNHTEKARRVFLQQTSCQAAANLSAALSWKPHTTGTKTTISPLHFIVYAANLHLCPAVWSVCVCVCLREDYWRSTWTVRGCCLLCPLCLTALRPPSLHLKPRLQNTILFTLS